MKREQRNKRLEELFRLGVDVGRADRAGFLERHCGNDEELRAELEALLAQDDHGTKHYLHSPVLSSWSRDRGDTSRVPSDADPARQVVGGARTDKIGRYRVIEKIGEGGMGAVYLARQEEPVQRDVALKIVKLGMDTRRVVARFDRERQALAMMDHPGIARIFDGGATENGRPYFVMEYVPGLPITEYCDSEALGVPERLRLFVRICEAVHHAHKKGVVHRDLKPSNVLVTERDGRPVPKIIDFGIARASADPRPGEYATGEHEVIGTYAYMSPEQADPGPTPIDGRSDVYSLGVVLYELLAGVLPFDVNELRGKSPSEVSQLLRDTDPPAPSTKFSRLGHTSTALARRRGLDGRRLVRRLSGELDWITLKAMERDVDRRYSSAEMLAGDVRRHLDRRAVLAGPPSRLYRFAKLARRHRERLAVAGAFALVLAGGAASLLRASAGRDEVRAAYARVDRASSRADEDAERIEHTRKYLLDAVDLTNPDRGGAAPGSLASLLLDLGAELDTVFAGDPEGEGTLRLSLGHALHARGELVDAREHLERSAELLADSSSDPALAYAPLFALYRLDIDEHGYSSAPAEAPAAGAALALLRKTAPELSLRGERLLIHTQALDLARVERELDGLERALRGMRLRAADRLLVADVLELAGAHLGHYFAFPEGGPLLELSLAQRRIALGPAAPQVTRSLEVTTSHLLRQGQAQRAADLASEIARGFRQARPDSAWSRAKVQSMHGECDSLAGRDREGGDELEQAHRALLHAGGQGSRAEVLAALRLLDHLRRDDSLRAEGLNAVLGSPFALARNYDQAWLRTLRALDAEPAALLHLADLLRAARGSSCAPDPREALTKLLDQRFGEPRLANLVVLALQDIDTRVPLDRLDLSPRTADALLALRQRAARERIPRALAVDETSPTASDHRQPHRPQPELLVADANPADSPPPPRLEDETEEGAEEPELTLEEELVADLREAVAPAEPDVEEVLRLAWFGATKPDASVELYEAITVSLATATEKTDTHPADLGPTALYASALSEARLGDFGSALRKLELAEALVRELDAAGHAVLAFTLASSGELELAHSYLERAEEQAAQEKPDRETRALIREVRALLSLSA
ncbi:MAG: serine/threonine-protein kinase [Planctomycetota bacterium]